MLDNKLLKIRIQPLILMPSTTTVFRIIGSAIAVLEDVVGKCRGRRQIFEGRNVLCDFGDIYVAQMFAGDTPDDDFAAGGLKLGTGVTGPLETDTDIETYVAASYKTIKATYPKQNDADANNGGAGVKVCTFAYFYDQAEVNVANINEYAICTDVAAPPDGILNHGHFSAAFTKIATQTLTVFVNFAIDKA